MGHDISYPTRKVKSHQIKKPSPEIYSLSRWKGSKQGRHCALIVGCGRRKKEKILLLFKIRGGKSGVMEATVM